jgi:hypothetical protein
VLQRLHMQQLAEQLLQQQQLQQLSRSTAL